MRAWPSIKTLVKTEIGKKYCSGESRCGWKSKRLFFHWFEQFINFSDYFLHSLEWKLYMILKEPNSCSKTWCLIFLDDRCCQLALEYFKKFLSLRKMTFFIQFYANIQWINHLRKFFFNSMLKVVFMTIIYWRFMPKTRTFIMLLLRYWPKYSKAPWKISLAEHIRDMILFHFCMVNLSYRFILDHSITGKSTTTVKFPTLHITNISPMTKK